MIQHQKQSLHTSVSGNRPRGARPNRSGFVGVHFHKRTGKWTAQVTLVDSKRAHVPGLYQTPEAANAAREAFIAARGVADGACNAPEALA
ncbi:AP2 domain-containing protein [Trinickia dinghuensis]|uniref:AP2 domain-containing protein n=1 Tax=Trinickia dinghuensis TaxID=2291023 RepID=UPI0015F14B4B|nr:AP2 domain-containing protein [Trinickia dinghuensis]